MTTLLADVWRITAPCATVAFTTTPSVTSTPLYVIDLEMVSIIDGVDH